MVMGSSVTPVLELRRDVQSGNKLMTGVMAVVFTDSGNNIPYMFGGAYINLTPMVLGDSIVVRVRKMIAQGGSLDIVDQTTYTDAQPVTHPEIFISPLPDIYGVEIAMQQTAGAVFRIIPCEFWVAHRIGL